MMRKLIALFALAWIAAQVSFPDGLDVCTRSHSLDTCHQALFR